MNRFIKYFFVVALFFASVMISSGTAQAVAISCSNSDFTFDPGPDGVFNFLIENNTVSAPTERIILNINNVTVDGQPINPAGDNQYRLLVSRGTPHATFVNIPNSQINNGSIQNVDITDAIIGIVDRNNTASSQRFTVTIHRGNETNTGLCIASNINVLLSGPQVTACQNETVRFVRLVDGQELPGTAIYSDDRIRAYVDPSLTSGFVLGNWNFVAERNDRVISRTLFETISNGNGMVSRGGPFTRDIGPLPAGTYTVVVMGVLDDTRYCSINNSSFQILPRDPTSTDATFRLCSQIPSSVPDRDAKMTACITCADQNGVWTAVGCIQTDAQSIVKSVMRLGLGLAGGIALIMILGAGFLYSTSQGDVKRTGEARDMMTSAIIGLLFIIFSVTILQFVGVSILQIPGFGG